MFCPFFFFFVTCKRIHTEQRTHRVSQARIFFFFFLFFFFSPYLSIHKRERKKSVRPAKTKLQTPCQKQSLSTLEEEKKRREYAPLNKAKQEEQKKYRFIVRKKRKLIFFLSVKVKHDTQRKQTKTKKKSVRGSRLKVKVTFKRKKKKERERKSAICTFDLVFSSITDSNLLYLYKNKLFISSNLGLLFALQATCVLLFFVCLFVCLFLLFFFLLISSFFFCCCCCFPFLFILLSYFTIFDL